MYTRPPFDPNGNPDQIVDKLIANAYDTVRYLAENLEYVKHVSFHLESVYNVEQDMQVIEDMAAFLPQLNDLHNIIPQIESIFANLVSIITVGDNIDAVLNLNTNIAKLQAIHTNLTELLAVEDSLTELKYLHANMDKLLDVYSKLTEISAVYVKLPEVASVADSIANVDAVAGKLVEIVNLSQISTDISTVADIRTAVQALAEQSSELSALYTNLTKLIGIYDNLDSLQSFSDTWLGARNTDPVADIAGSTLDGGELYWNIPNSVLKFYTGTAWVSFDTAAVAAEVMTQLASTAPGEGASLVKYENGLTVEQMLPLVQVNSVYDLCASSWLQIDSLQVSVAGFYKINDKGCGIFYWDSSFDKLKADGGTVIDPDALNGFDGSQETLYKLFDAVSGQGTNIGNGCFVRIHYQNLIPNFFGALGDGITDDAIALEAWVNSGKYSHNSLEGTPEGTYLTTKGLWLGEAFRADSIRYMGLSFPVHIRAAFNGGCVLDFTSIRNGGSEFHFTVSVEPGFMPNYGILFSRPKRDTGVISSGSAYVRCIVAGDFKCAAGASYSSESNKFDKCKFNNKSGSSFIIADHDYLKGTVISTISNLTGTILQGETLIGASSGATGIAELVNSQQVFIVSINGNFQASETISGSSSGAAFVLNDANKIVNASPNWANGVEGSSTSVYQIFDTCGFTNGTNVCMAPFINHSFTGVTSDKCLFYTGTSGAAIFLSGSPLKNSFYSPDIDNSPDIHVQTSKSMYTSLNAFTYKNRTSSAIPNKYEFDIEGASLLHVDIDLYRKGMNIKNGEAYQNNIIRNRDGNPSDFNLDNARVSAKLFGDFNFIGDFHRQSYIILQNPKTFVDTVISNSDSNIVNGTVLARGDNVILTQAGNIHTIETLGVESNRVFPQRTVRMQAPINTVIEHDTGNIRTKTGSDITVSQGTILTFMRIPNGHWTQV